MNRRFQGSDPFAHEDLPRLRQDNGLGRWFRPVGGSLPSEVVELFLDAAAKAYSHVFASKSVITISGRPPAA